MKVGGMVPRLIAEREREREREHLRNRAEGDQVGTVHICNIRTTPRKHEDKG